MKIALFTDVFTEKIISGAVVSIIRISKGLADRGHKIYLIVPDGEDTIKLKHKNIEIIQVPSIPAFFYPGFRLTSFYNPKITEYLKKEKVEIIYLTTPMILGIEAVLTAKKLKIPLAGTFHTLVYKADYLKVVGLDFWIIKKILLWFHKFLYSRCDLVTCPSESALKEILMYKLGGKRNIAISNGIDPKIFDNKKAKEIKNKYNPNGKIILYVGRISDDKKIFYLFDIFKMITEKLPNVRMIMIGGGVQMKEVKEKIEKLGIENKIFLLGQMKHEKLVRSGVFGASDLFMTASITETEGITTLESQVNGLVCVGTNASGTKDLIKNNYNGFLVKDGNKEEFAEKVIRLLTDEKLYKRMRKNTLKEVKKYYVNKIISKWEKEFRNLIKNNKNK